MTKNQRKVDVFRPKLREDWTDGQKLVHQLWRVFWVAVAAGCMGAVLLLLAVGPYGSAIYDPFRNVTLLALNVLPVALLILLLFSAFGRTWLAFLVGGGITLGMSLGNYYKLTFRDDPFYFEDLLILREATAMTMEQDYSLFVNKVILFLIACWLLGTLALFLIAPGKCGKVSRISVASLVLIGTILLIPVYRDTKRYNSVENYEHLNRWSPTQNFVAHGFYYPFLHSLTDLVDEAPEGYSEKKAEQLLSSYEDGTIAEEQQVNVIAVMREAYVDFSQYGIAGLDCSGYDLYHSLEQESYCGDLLVNIFAGGTIDSERTFLTGNYELRNFRGNANSYLWYLREQGYKVEGCHPYYQWFYNRRNVNSYLGFQNYRFLEGDFENLTSAYLPEDSIFYDEVYKDYVANKETPYFSYSLNIQSHGPYGTTASNVSYLTGNYSEECKHAMNNYMDAIMQGDKELLGLVERLRYDDEPVVLITFGDHLPWMGDGNIFYDEIGLNIDPQSEEGLRNHYTTRYLIWANEAAKKILGHEVKGEGPTISPCYLMNLLFDQLGWEGPAFMQYMADRMETMPVVSSLGIYWEDGALTTEAPKNTQQWQEFQTVQYYWRNEFMFGK